MWFAAALKQQTNTGTRFTCFYLCVSLSQTPAPWTRRAWISPSSGRSARGPPSLTRRSSSWSAASTTSGTCPGRSAQTWRPPWSSQRLRSRSGSRTGATRRNAARWPRIWWRRLPRPRRWRWKFWCGTTRDSTARERSCGPRCSPCSRPTITRTRTASLHGHCLRARGTSENSLTVFIHFLLFSLPGNQTNYIFSDKRRRLEGDWTYSASASSSPPDLTRGPQTFFIHILKYSNTTPSFI